jgi:chromate transporter
MASLTVTPSDERQGHSDPSPEKQGISSPPHPTFMQALRFWLKLGFISFGGPAGQIAIMQHELVERRRWVSTERFLNALNYSMLLPGPEAQQLATYIGWLLHKIP